jgi:hypothetical protein
MLRGLATQQPFNYGEPDWRISWFDFVAGLEYASFLGTLPFATSALPSPLQFGIVEYRELSY